MLKCENKVCLSIDEIQSKFGIQKHFWLLVARQPYTLIRQLWSVDKAQKIAWKMTENLTFNDLDKGELFYKETKLKELGQQISRFSENPKEKSSQKE